MNNSSSGRVNSSSATGCTSGCCGRNSATASAAQRAPLHFTVFQTVQRNASHAAFAAQDQAVLGALAALGQHSIGKAEKAVLPDGLELVVVCAHHIGLYGKFRRRGHKDDLHRRVVPADLPGGIDAVDAGHEHIQKQHIKAHPGLDIRQKLHGLCIGASSSCTPRRVRYCSRKSCI